MIITIAVMESTTVCLLTSIQMAPKVTRMTSTQVIISTNMG